MPDLDDAGLYRQSLSQSLQSRASRAPPGGSHMKFAHLWAGQDVGLDRVHIHFCGNGHLWFRLTAAHF
ncbi:hypothetical protein EMIT0P176_160118 [Pseudomonas sp. IT-P176]